MPRTEPYQSKNVNMLIDIEMFETRCLSHYNYIMSLLRIYFLCSVYMYQSYTDIKKLIITVGVEFHKGYRQTRGFF